MFMKPHTFDITFEMSLFSEETLNLSVHHPSIQISNEDNSEKIMKNPNRVGVDLPTR